VTVRSFALFGPAFWSTTVPIRPSIVPPTVYVFGSQLTRTPVTSATPTWPVAPERVQGPEVAGCDAIVTANETPLATFALKVNLPDAVIGSRSMTSSLSERPEPFSPTTFPPMEYAAVEHVTATSVMSAPALVPEARSTPHVCVGFDG
jgi:hypothetical protein